MIGISSPPIYDTHIGGSRSSTPSMDRSTNPGVDFYKYVNKEWQAHIHLPPYYDSFGVSEEIEEEVRDSLLHSIEKQRREDPTDPVSMIATSFLHTKSQHNSVVDLQRILNTFDCISDTANVAHSIGALNKIQTSAPISLVVANNAYNVNKCCVYLYEPSLGIPKQYYDSESRRRNPIMTHYIQLLTALGKRMNIESLESVVAIESEMLHVLSEDDELSNIEFIHNLNTYTELCKKYKNIPWGNIMKGWGASEKVYKHACFIVTNPRYFSKLNKMFRDADLETWRTWMRAMTLLSFVEYLPPPFDDMHFELYGRALKGNTEKLPQKFLTLSVLQRYATQDLSKMFVKYDVHTKTKTLATRLVKELLHATLERLDALDWMSIHTKKGAIQKVKSMKFQVAYPDIWDSETEGVAIDPERPLLNIVNLATQDTMHVIDNLAHNRCKRTETHWDDGAFEVNAYYYPEGNRIVIPAGILRAPFFDVDRSDAWNLGGIGSVIGHEITHGFDADGRMYDAHGEYASWWTTRDTHTFNILTQKVIDLFDDVEYMGGSVNGTLTLSENLADLGGVAIALQALNNTLSTNAAERKKAYTEFFTSYAVSWRTKDRAKKAKDSLLSDSHAPAQLRVNLVVKQFQEFYEAFGIGPDDEGWVPPEKRIRLW